MMTSISSCVFLFDDAGNSGRAIVIARDAETTIISHCQIIGCRTRDSGGAILVTDYAYGETKKCDRIFVTLENCEMIDCRSTEGGCLYFEHAIGHLSLNNVICSDCYSDSCVGHAIYISKIGSFTWTDLCLSSCGVEDNKLFYSSDDDPELLDLKNGIFGVCIIIPPPTSSNSSTASCYFTKSKSFTTSHHFTKSKSFTKSSQFTTIATTLEKFRTIHKVTKSMTFTASHSFNTAEEESNDGMIGLIVGLVGNTVVSASAVVVVLIFLCRKQGKSTTPTGIDKDIDKDDSERKSEIQPVVEQYCYDNPYNSELDSVTYSGFE